MDCSKKLLIFCAHLSTQAPPASFRRHKIWGKGLDPVFARMQAGLVIKGKMECARGIGIIIIIILET